MLSPQKKLHLIRITLKGRRGGTVSDRSVVELPPGVAIRITPPIAASNFSMSFGVGLSSKNSNPNHLFLRELQHLLASIHAKDG